MEIRDIYSVFTLMNIHCSSLRDTVGNRQSIKNRHREESLLKVLYIKVRVVVRKHNTD